MSEAKRQKTANHNAIIVFILFAISLLLGATPASVDGSLGTRDIAWVAFSLLAFLTLLYSMYISYRQADERQRLIQLQATSISFATVMLGIFIVQLLDAVHLATLKLSTQIVFMGGIILWLILLRFLERRSQ
jgi:uncharacterized membrane protein